MVKIFRFVAIISFFYVINFLFILTINADTSDTIKPPTGLIGKQELTSIELFWSNGSDFSGRVDGYLVYYWQTDQTILNVKQVTKDVIMDQKFKIENLLPNTEYSFIVRSATKESSEKLEKYKDYYLSQFSQEYSIKTKLDWEIKLLMSNVNGGLIEVSKYVTHKRIWVQQNFFVNLGNEIGEVRNADDLEIDFRTGYILQDIRSKTIEHESENLNSFEDPRDPNIKIEINDNKKLKTGVVYEAVLINSEGTKIVLQRQN